MPGILLYLLPATAYAALGILCTRALRKGEAPVRSATRGLLAVALVLHGASLSHALFEGGSLRFGFGAALSLTLWLAMLFYFLESFIARLDGLPAIAAPIAALCCLLPWLLPGHSLPDGDTRNWAFRAHVVVAMLAYSLFTLAALHALLMALAERQLHHARLSRGLAGLPPLLVLENLLFRLIGVAFLLLTLTVLSGVFFSEQLFGKSLVWSHKTIFTIAAWLLFGALLAGRRAWGWRGRTAQRYTLAGFVCLLLAYAGTRFVLEVILGR
ncbi:MAG: cytochrome c biogenesis protein CcsA [Moraxellaceae bacterium]|nr:cytochrome c biogenesis protein CcsA [Moraxellaceae bacterium]